jgi:hypothetical protein
LEQTWIPHVNCERLMNLGAKRNALWEQEGRKGGDLLIGFMPGRILSFIQTKLLQVYNRGEYPFRIDWQRT